MVFINGPTPVIVELVTGSESNQYITWASVTPMLSVALTSKLKPSPALAVASESSEMTVGASLSITDTSTWVPVSQFPDVSLMMK